MAAIISDKFRIFNAQQFLESLSEGSSDVGNERTRMYFFVGRPQRWDAYLEVYNKNSTAFAVGQTVYIGASFAAATFKGTIREVRENSLLLYSIGPTVSSAPALGSNLKCWDGTADTGATALTGVYRYATEDVPPLPLDNLSEKYSVYDDFIALKRITSDYARSVIRRYNWDLTANPKFDMWRPDYFATANGIVGNQSGTGASSIADSKFYVINSQYEVFKCLYNGTTPAYPSGQNATSEPKTTPSPGTGTYAGGLYKEESGTAGYIWKYMFTVPTDDVIRFLSTDFIPIVQPSNASRAAVQAAAVAGSINVILVRNAGSNLPNGTFYAPILGDGTGGVAKLVIASGAITAATVQTAGSGYTYASVALKTGTGSGATAYGLFTDSALTTSQTVGGTAVGSVVVVLPPQGGHGGADMEGELNAKRVMTNIRLTYAEGSGDFPVDNDFRRIGIIRDPYNYGTTTYATVDTLNSLYAVKITGATASYQADEIISQTVNGNTAYGTVVSWTLDSGSTTSGVLKYIQSPELHTSNGKVRSFASGANTIAGASSGAAGSVDATTNGTILGVTFTNGFATPEIENNSGEIIYVENRRLITRAADQIEDIKLVIEF
jgi:hypothetical protein